MRRPLAALSLAALAVLLLAAPAGAGGGGHLCGAFADSSVIEMRDSCFEAVATVVEAGTVTVRNAGYVDHNLAAVDGSFASGAVAPGGEATLTVASPGLHRIYCTLHGTVDGAGMAGILFVGDPAAPVPGDAAGDPAAPAAPAALPWVATGLSSAAALALVLGGRGSRQRVPVAE